jgi:hypothetical protein
MDIVKSDIKQHDFVTGTPTSPIERALKDWCDLTLDRWGTNPCGEIQLADWQETILRDLDGIGSGELNITLAPPATGRTMLNPVVFDKTIQISSVNLDYMHLYPEVQRVYNISPEREPCPIQSTMELLNLTNEEIIENNNLRRWENES